MPGMPDLEMWMKARDLIADTMVLPEIDDVWALSHPEMAEEFLKKTRDTLDKVMDLLGPGNAGMLPAIFILALIEKLSSFSGLGVGAPAVASVEGPDPVAVEVPMPKAHDLAPGCMVHWTENGIAQSGFIVAIDEDHRTMTVRYHPARLGQIELSSVSHDVWCSGSWNGGDVRG
jgi:hypothetical protein